MNTSSDTAALPSADEPRRGCYLLLNTLDDSQPENQWVVPDGSRVEATPPPFPLPPGVRPLPPSPALDGRVQAEWEDRRRRARERAGTTPRPGGAGS